MSSWPTKTGTLYVVGLESSGTRWLANALFTCVQNKTTWDGERPACVSTPIFNIFHVSIPWGGTCHENELPPLLTPRCSDFSARVHDVPRHLPRRWNINLEKVLEREPASRGILIRRNHRDALASKMRNEHCTNTSQSLREMKTGNEIIVNARRSRPHQTTFLDYDYMDDDVQWELLTSWLNLSCRPPGGRLRFVPK